MVSVIHKMISFPSMRLTFHCADQEVAQFIAKVIEVIVPASGEYCLMDDREVASAVC